jgi:hypothetical protein
LLGRKKGTCNCRRSCGTHQFCWKKDQCPGGSLSINKSQIRELLEVGKIGRSHTYLLKEEYRKASADQLQKVYMKRVRYTPGDLYRDLHGHSQANPVEPGSAGGDTHREIRITGRRVTLVLVEPDV